MKYTMEKINEMIERIDRLNESIERRSDMENIRKEVDNVIDNIEKLDKSIKKEYLRVMAKNIKKLVSNEDMFKIMGTKFILDEIQHLKDILK